VPTTATRTLHGARSSLLERGAELVAAARAAGATVSVDTNDDPSGRFERPDWLSGVDLLLPNDREALALAGEVGGRRIELPVRVLFGRRDSAQDHRQLRGLREHAPDSRIELADAGHWIVDERPDLVADRARALFG
jgi:pimeloyl-ACP methyl ester carboxylesterase